MTQQEMSRPGVADLSPSALADRVGSPQRVVIVGAGFGGYFAARALARTLKPHEARITVVSDTDGLVYQPLLPEVAVGALDPRAISVPLSTLKGVHLVRGTLDAVDVDAQTVSLTNGSGARQELAYDRLLLSPGGVTRTFDVAGLRERALGFKTVGQALYLRDLLLERMESANDEPDPAARRRLLSFVVVGAGYAGTELIAQMSRLSTNLLRAFPRVAAQDLRWMLLDTASAVMPELGASLGDDALTVLRGRGIDVRLGTSIEQISPSAAVLTDGTTVEGAIVVWCAGVAPSPLVEATGLPTDRGRLAVDADLRVRGADNVYAIGDAAAVPNLAEQPQSDGTHPPCPPTAQHAMRQGQAVARNIVADVRRLPRRPYRHRDLGLVVDLGGRQAVARPLGIAIHGPLAKVVTRGYHLFALPTAKRRLQVSAGWLLAGRTPDDVAFGLPPGEKMLASHEHSLPPTVEHHDVTEPQAPRG